MKERKAIADTLPRARVFSKGGSPRFTQEPIPLRLQREDPNMQLVTSRDHNDMKQEASIIKDGVMKLFIQDTDSSFDLDNKSNDILSETLKAEVAHLRGVESRLKGEMEALKIEHSRVLIQLKFQKDNKIDHLESEREYLQLKYNRIVEDNQKTIEDLQKELSSREDYYQNLMRIQQDSFNAWMEQYSSLQQTAGLLKVQKEKTTQGGYEIGALPFATTEPNPEVQMGDAKMFGSQQQNIWSEQGKEVVQLRARVQAVSCKLHGVTVERDTLQKTLRETQSYTNGLQFQLQKYISDSKINYLYQR